MSGSQRTPLIGVCMPPEDETTLEHLETALFRFQGGPTPIVFGDVNSAFHRKDRAVQQPDDTGWRRICSNLVLWIFAK